MTDLTPMDAVLIVAGMVLFIIVNFIRGEIAHGQNTRGQR